MEIFFGFSNSEFINDNTFSLKDKKSDIGTLTRDSILLTRVMFVGSFKLIRDYTKQTNP